MRHRRRAARGLWPRTPGNACRCRYPDEIHEVLVDARDRLERASAALVAIDTDARGRQAAQAAGPDARPVGRIGDLEPRRSTGATSGYVDVRLRHARAPAPRDRPARRRPGAARRACGSERTAVLTSATVPASLAGRVGLPPADHRPASTSAARSTTRTTPCCTAPCTCPTPVRPAIRAAVHDELVALITAAGGRTLALFTSWKAMDLAAAAVAGARRRADPHPARPARSRRCCASFAADEATCLFATAGFFQGVDVPGPHAVAGRHRPAPVPAARRPAAVGAPRAARRRPRSARSTCRARR